jgi:putative transposase
MRTKYHIFDKEAIYFVTSTIVDWIEIFNNDNYFNLLIDSFEFRKKNENMRLFAYVIMKDHFHAIISSNDLRKTITYIKSYTAKKILELLEIENNFTQLNKLKNAKLEYKNRSNYQVWQEGYHPQQILSMNMFRQKAEYIHENPVRKGYVEKSVDWKYSSASNYYLGHGIIELDPIV